MPDQIKQTEEERKKILNDAGRIPLGEGLLQKIRDLLAGGRTGRIDAYVEGANRDTSNRK